MRPIDFNEIIAFKSNARVRAEVCGISYYPRHSHSTCTEFLCVLNGEVSIFDGAMKYHLGKDDLHIFNAGDPHMIFSEDPESILLIVQVDKQRYTGYHPGILRGWFSIHSYDPSNRFLPEVRFLRYLLASIYFEHRKATPSDMDLEKKVQEMIDLLYDYFHHHRYCSNPLGGFAIVRNRNAFKADDGFKRVYDIEDYVEDHFREKTTLAEIAQMHHFSEAYLSKVIKNSIGITFSEMYSIVRCSEAERLLASTTRSVEDIAQDVGFSNRSHLTKQFVKWYDITPHAYRKRVFDDFTGENVIRYHPVQKDFAEETLHEYLNG